MKRRASLLGWLLLALTTPAAAQEWAEHYLAARRHVQEGQCAPAIKELRAAIRLKPVSKVDEQTYSLWFVDYFPYYYLGVCQHRVGDFAAAVASFDAEVKQGAIQKKSSVYKDLQRLRQEAQAEVEKVERQARLRAAQDRVEAQLERSLDLERERRFNEALEQLTQAQKTAEPLDAPIRNRVQDRLVHLQKLKREAEEAEARARRIAQALDEARRLYDANHDQDAILKFDEVLALDPKNPAAEQGKHEAQQRIMAATTRQEREKAFAAGQALFEQGNYADALPYLSQAASDPSNAAAQALLARAQQMVEGIRRQREARRNRERLMAEGDAALAAGRWAAAQVKFQEVLALDPTDVRAREREAVAERRSEEATLERRRPNRPPSLVILEPASTALETASDTLSVAGVATDDRGLTRIEFFVAGKKAAEQAVPPSIDSREPQREQSFQRPFPLAAGANEIRVRVTDVGGLTQEATFVVTRRLRLDERRDVRIAALASLVGLAGLGLLAHRLRRRRAVKRRFNPYIAGAPVADDHLFFGRQQLLTRVLNLLHHNSFMITGERRIGKTSFLLRLKRALELEDGPAFRFFPVLIDLQGVCEDGFFQAIMSDTVDTLAPAPETMAALRYAPGRSHYEGRDFSHDVQLVLNELATRTTRKVKLAFLMDEIDVLNDYSERTNQLLRSIFMKTFSEHLVAVMCGVGLKRAWISDASPWYNFFEQIRLTPFSRADAEALIRTPVAGVFRYEPPAVESILEYSQLKPYLIQKFCIQAVNRILEERRTTVTALDIESVRAQTLAEVDAGAEVAAAQRASA